MSNKAFLGTACIATCLLLSVGQLAAETRQETALSYIELGNKFMHQATSIAPLALTTSHFDSHRISLPHSSVVPWLMKRAATSLRQ